MCSVSTHAFTLSVSKCETLTVCLSGDLPCVRKKNDVFVHVDVVVVVVVVQALQVHGNDLNRAVTYLTDGIGGDAFGHSASSSGGAHSVPMKAHARSIRTSTTNPMHTLTSSAMGDYSFDNTSSSFNATSRRSGFHNPDPMNAHVASFTPGHSEGTESNPYIDETDATANSIKQRMTDTSKTFQQYFKQFRAKGALGATCVTAPALAATLHAL